jgi:hypothetical protein
MATWPSGKARVCKTLITGSNPVVASGMPGDSLKMAVFIFMLYSNQLSSSRLEITAIFTQNLW